MLGVRIAGLGSGLPEAIVTNDQLALQGYDTAWVVQRSGVLQRRCLAADLSTSDMAVQAARRCLEHAGRDPSEVELVVVSTSSPDYPVPATAAVIQERLGMCALAYDIQAGCAGFVVGLINGMQHVLSGSGRAALIVAAESHSRVINPADPQTYPLFGDGAAAALVTPGQADQGLLSFVVGSDGAGAGLLVRALGGARLPYVDRPDDPRRYLAMEGKPVFKWAVRIVADTVRQALQAAGVTIDDISLAVLHQANLRILHAAADDLGIDRAKLAVNLDRYGNTGSASVPLLLDEAVRAGRIRRGDLILLSGFGAGLTWATGVMKW